MHAVSSVRWWVHGSVVVVLALAMSGGALVRPARGEWPQRPPIGEPIGAAYVQLDPANQDYRKNPYLLTAFVPTESLNRRCLVTLSEATYPEPGMVVFCAPRQQLDVSGRLVDGILISIFLPSEAQDDLYVSLTVYQQFARRYGPPVPYTGD